MPSILFNRSATICSSENHSLFMFPSGYYHFKRGSSHPKWFESLGAQVNSPPSPGKRSGSNIEVAGSKQAVGERMEFYDGCKLLKRMVGPAGLEPATR
jgi:hypothetical protein